MDSMDTATVCAMIVLAPHMSNGGAIVCAAIFIIAGLFVRAKK